MEEDKELSAISLRFAKCLETAKIELMGLLHDPHIAWKKLWSATSGTEKLPNLASQDISFVLT